MDDPRPARAARRARGSGASDAEMWNAIWSFVVPLVRRAYGNAHLAGLTLPQVGILRILAVGGPVTAGALREGLGVTLPSVTSAVDHLERGGLVRRERSPQDRRVVRVSLTDRGERALERYWALQHQGHRGLSRRLTRTERQELARLLTRLGEGPASGGSVPKIPYARCPRGSDR